MNCFALASLAISLLLIPSSAKEHANVQGVNVGGWLLIEEWMFSNGLFDKVSELRDEPQGVIFPPSLPNGFGENWYSEGDLVFKLNNKFGSKKTVDILQQHRSSYITSKDFEEMAAAGIKQVRLPIGWWAFTNHTEPTLISDPAHGDRMFVTITSEFLKCTLRDMKNAGLEALIDIHAFPGGSADGSFNGVYPNTALFFKEQYLQEQGFDIINNMFLFYNSLDDDVRRIVTGVTLMNEPCQAMPEDKDTMVWWMGVAASMFRASVVEKHPGDHPNLYMNLIGSCIPDEESLSFMINTFSKDELNQWAILDVHTYYAWAGSLSGCMWLNGDCGWECLVDTDTDAFAGVTDMMISASKSSHAFFINNGSVPLVACSEFSLATYHDSNNACRGVDMLDMMYDAQADGFDAQGMLDKSMFWTWKMPYGGSHEDAWSLQNYLARRALR